MPSFAFESGHLVPATFGRQGPSRLNPDHRSALRRYLLDVLEADLFPICWSDGAEPVLTAMDPAGQVVTALVVDRLDEATLMRALAGAGENAAASWLTIAGRYRSGVAGFRRDWNAFRESRPAGAQPGPQLYLVAGDVSAEVLAGLRVMHGVRVVAVDVREGPSGAPLLDVTDVAPSRVRVFDGEAEPELAPVTGPVAPVGSTAVPETAPASIGRAAAPATAPAPAEPVRSAPVAAAATAPPPQPPAAHPTTRFPLRREPEPVRASEHLRAVAALVDAPVRIVLRSRERDHTAWLRQDGVVVVSGGVEHGELDAAAAHLLGHEPADAWSQWRFAEGGLALADARAEVIRTDRSGHRQAPAAQAARTGGEPSRRALRSTEGNGSRRGARH
ncbi:hypothetical protein EXU48_12605 [Occultella glacieicola]|uniref:RAMA domain-containing protein n=1 Tax=Occultella glacieicola TaxID=2518684 RepID=A0ABY2E4Y1_9MICO|nr:hypothetical protein [Occultella glacieicola]TDE94263.1 hypothetical protein EXU48_12605 [Occultella glacieicola]